MFMYFMYFINFALIINQSMGSYVFVVRYLSILINTIRLNLCDKSSFDKLFVIMNIVTLEIIYHHRCALDFDYLWSSDGFLIFIMILVTIRLALVKLMLKLFNIIIIVCALLVFSMILKIAVRINSIYLLCNSNRRSSQLTIYYYCYF